MIHSAQRVRQNNQDGVTSMQKSEALLYGALFIALTVATNIFVTKFFIDKSFKEYQWPSIPKIVTIDLERIVQDKIDEGMTTLQVVTFTDTLTQVLLSDGFIILDAKTVINAPPQHVLKNVSTEQLGEMVKLKGIKIKDDKTYEKALEDAQKQFDEVLKAN